MLLPIKRTSVNCLTKTLLGSGCSREGKLFMIVLAAAFVFSQKKLAEM